MKKILLIIRREYLTRVKKRSFIVMTILGPILMAAAVVIPLYLATRANEVKTVSILDETGLFTAHFKDSDNFRFHELVSDIQSAKKGLVKSGDYALIYIPATQVTLPSNAIIYAQNTVNINLQSYVKNVMSRQVEEMKLQAKLHDIQSGKDQPVDVSEILKSIQTTIDINTLKIGEDGTESKSYTEINMALGMFAGILIYLFIFMFGSQVMRGVIEEKTSRIVEVIVSSVRPFQLMMGKIIGVGLVGLTQFMLWVVLTFVIVTGVTATITPRQIKDKVTGEVLKTNKPISPVNSESLTLAQGTSGDGTNEVLQAINSVDFPVMIGSFLFFFLAGYLLYSALFAAIGGAVDNEADTQQFIAPITIPLILAIILAQFIIQDPDGPLSFWFSIIPFTSPVVMMIRIPFGVPWIQVILSMVLLILGFLATTWIAAKIYRTGILMYGKKVNYKELWKWLRQG